ncbi:hypothetical protein TpMuguga_01g00501 [Theileria parva strain Muguga]|uniref:Uncharacterized protein n=1 Tax=Theileria parva TaxID=5875 RepID=Q4N8H0_THEPA|nr:uncharacterized protein TpMuguga_01g00501 [Theileria parva strain Muguga]EAN33738.1 hypothetical protein TpMuguga_01g00501 [Theileria parva strain Muguga]|eukprot:XP_766021.1 hypothetical protein [Theileria parva strain Muguga]
MSDRIIPNFRIKRILEIDEHMPKMNKKALTTLAAAVKVFLQEYAKDLHKHIVNTGDSYPVNTKHIINVSYDPRFIKYEFLTHARKIIEKHDDNTTPINKLIGATSNIGSSNCTSATGLGNKPVEMNEGSAVTSKQLESSVKNNTVSNSDNSKKGLKKVLKTSSKGGVKKIKNSILSYFTSRN